MSNMSKIVISIIVALIIILGAVSYFSKGDALPSDIKADKTIVYDGSKFDPATVEINVGESVAFVNQSTSGMWVASASHPTHTDYPEFDAKKSYGQGESYTFTFSRVGNWNFHNHMNPTAFGSVIVK